MSASDHTASQRTISVRKLAANRANARKSTGPRTRRGKRRSSMNGLRHGFFAQHLVLRGENVREFARLRKRFMQDLRPTCATELLLVERIVSASWRLRRLQTIESVTHHTQAGIDLAQSDDFDLLCDDESIDESERRRSRKRFVARATRMPSISTIARGLANGDDVMERLSRYEQRLDLLIHRSLRQLEKMRRRSQEPPVDESSEAQAPPRVVNESASAPSASFDQNERSEATADSTLDSRTGRRWNRAGLTGNVRPIEVIDSHPCATGMLGTTGNNGPGCDVLLTPQTQAHTNSDSLSLSADAPDARRED